MIMHLTYIVSKGSNLLLKIESDDKWSFLNIQIYTVFFL